MKLHPTQRHIVNSNKSKKAYIGGRVSGKTQLVVAEALKSATECKNTIVFAPVNRMVMNVRDRVVDEADKMDISYSTKNKCTVEFDCGGNITFQTLQSTEWGDEVRASTSVIVDESQATTFKQLQNFTSMSNVVIVGQHQKRLHKVIPYGNDEWEYAICPTAIHAGLNTINIEKKQMYISEEQFRNEFLIRLFDLTNEHTLLMPEKAYPYWSARCLDCGYSKSVDVRDGVNSRVKEYIIGDGLTTPCE